MASSNGSTGYGKIKNGSSDKTAELREFDIKPGEVGEVIKMALAFSGIAITIIAAVILLAVLIGILMPHIVALMSAKIF